MKRLFSLFVCAFCAFVCGVDVAMGHGTWAGIMVVCSFVNGLFAVIDD